MTINEISSIAAQWKAENIELNQAATIVSIEEAEKITGFIFPSDFKSLYLKVDGFKNWGWRSNMFSIWPINRIIEEYIQDSNN